LAKSPLSSTAPVSCCLPQSRGGDIDRFDKVVATNLRGSYLVMSEAANHVVDGGRIIVFSSSVLGKSFPSYGAYIASKSGVEGLTRVLANELGPRKITVNAVAPGPVATDLFLNGKSEELIATIAKMAPFGRLGEIKATVCVPKLYPSALRFE
jgi:3-oxoacyl-[acyl-carrier protein] reductase